MRQIGLRAPSVPRKVEGAVTTRARSSSYETGCPSLALPIRFGKVVLLRSADTNDGVDEGRPHGESHMATARRNFGPAP
jgi:hypothetical protein